MKKITCNKAKMDINGNKTYLYNFIDTESISTQKELNSKFKYFGRLTNKGIKSQYEPNHMKDFLNRFGVWLNMDIGRNLGKAQKNIDRCNNKSGCNSCCGSSRQEQCSLLKNHSQLMSELSYIKEFLDLKEIETE